MRTLRLMVGACGLFLVRSAAAQQPNPVPPVVPMDNVAPPPPTPGPEAAAPAAGASQNSEPTAPAAAAASPPPLVNGGPGSVGGAVTSNDWKFDFHGYFRAPMRIGFGHNGGCPLCTPAETTTPAGQSQNSLHYPVTPDGQYLSWQYTSMQSSDWSELFFSYGNQWVKGTVGLQGYNFTDAAWEQATAQFGIAQGWLTFTPKLGYQNVRLEANVGAFWSKYGMAGKYDTGKYDTYLFGRTHQMGETVKMSIDVDKMTLWAEEGFGVKQPDPNVYNPAKFSLLAHAHGGLAYNRILSFNFHFLYAFAQSEDEPANLAGTGVTTQPNVGLPDGNMMIFGPEIAVRNTLIGEFYLGFSHITANHATVVDDVVEVIHSGGGQEFTQGIQGNYLDGPNKKSNGNGDVNTLLLQYDLSLANLIAGIKKASFWGDGPDLSASFFMMYNAISSDDTGTKALNGIDGMDGVHRLKWGVDVLGTPLKWLGIGIRGDRVQPNSNFPEQSFGIVSPRLVFRSTFLTHEEVTFQYSRYLYNDRTCPAASAMNPTSALQCTQPPPAPSLPNGFGAPVASLDANQRGVPNALPDLNTVKLQASMWW
jgi:hypothetical protein